MMQIQTPAGGRLTCYPAAEGSRKETVLICPGGGYSFLSPREGKPIAEAFCQAGYHGAVLEYCLEPEVLGTGPLKELAWCLRFLKTSETWQGKNEKIWVAGFSAGGHLAASLGALWNADCIFSQEEQRRNRPDGLILAYPVICMDNYGHARSAARLTGGREEEKELFSLEKRDLSQCPPVFIWNTLEDEKVPAMNSILFAKKLAEDGASCEYHLYHKGLHGMSLATLQVESEAENLHPDEHIASWFSLCLQWMSEAGAKRREE
ncbi:MAG: alpha/beta hydrolase [Lachnospiraceae bacterium]|nr:alpha/beta hydrolase [Lachnospiraceae bacterium]